MFKGGSYYTVVVPFGFLPMVKNGVLLFLGLFGLCFANIALAETRGFIINYIHMATHSDPRNCPGGGNGKAEDVTRRALQQRGYSNAQIQDLLNQNADDSVVEELAKITLYRGDLEGKQVSAHQYPESVPDLNLETVAGPYAYGFDLDGNGSEDEKGFEDPETGERGVDNELFRAMGCYEAYDVSYPERPWFMKSASNDKRVEMKAPAWLFTVTTEDFQRDGKATVVFYRAVGNMRHNQVKQGLANMTYVVDPGPRSYGRFEGEIKNGFFISSVTPVSMEMEGSFPHYMRLALSQARLRLDLNNLGMVSGYVGGYQPWMDYWYFISQGTFFSIDAAQSYHTLKRLADAEPDPNTGINTAISSTYRIDAIPAFIVKHDGTFVTSSR